MKGITVYLPVALYDKIQAKAKGEMLPASTIIRQIVVAAYKE